MIKVPASSSYSILEPSKCASKLMDKPSARPVKRRNWLRVRFIRGDFRRQPVVLVADVVVEGFRAIFVDQLGQFCQPHRLAELGLAAGVIHQGLGFSRASSSGRSSLSTKSLNALSRVRVSPGPSTPSWQPMKSRKYSETFLPFLPLMNEMYCLDCLLFCHSDTLMRAARYGGPGQVTGRRDIQFVGHRHAFAVVQQGDGQVIGHALLVMREQHVAAHRQVGLFHQFLQVFHRHATERGEILAAVQVLLQPAAERMRPGLGMEKPQALPCLAL